MSYHTDPNWRIRPAPVIDQNKLQRLCRRARARGVRLWGERDGYHRSMGVYCLFQTDDNGRSWKAFFGPTTLDAIEARLASIPTLKRHVVLAPEVIDLAETRRRRGMH